MCDDTRYPDICLYQVTESGEYKVSCDAKVCGSSQIQMASVDPQMGKAVTDWNPLPKDTITATVQEAVKTNLERGFSFLFLKCGRIYQVLSFSPIFKKVENGKSRSAINVNLVLLDSISRPHFYRTLPRASKALHKINEDSNITATALDFELVQSIGQQTFENMRPFFCGVLKGEFYFIHDQDVYVLLHKIKRRDSPHREKIMQLCHHALEDISCELNMGIIEGAKDISSR